MMGEKLIPKNFNRIARKKILAAIDSSDFIDVTYNEQYAFVTYKNGLPMCIDTVGRCLRQKSQIKE